jgi:prevent-host-death family protein
MNNLCLLHAVNKDSSSEGPAPAPACPSPAAKEEVDRAGLRSPPSVGKMTNMTKMIMKAHAGGRATWAVAEAKARFSEIIERALTDGPQTITRKGRQAVVVVSIDEWRRKTRRTGNLAEFFAASPLRGSGLKVKRTKGGRRAIEL